MGRPVVTSDQKWVRMTVVPVDEWSAVFYDVNGIKPSCWSLPDAGNATHSISVLFGRLPEGHRYAGMMSMWMNSTFDDTETSILCVNFDTIEDLPLIVEDKQWRLDDRELLKFCLERGLKQAMFSESAEVVD